jgi:hypothetical protein
MTGPVLAGEIRVTRTGRTVSLRIDGEEFRWYTGRGIQVTVDPDGTPGVTLTIWAEHVRVSDAIDAQAAGAAE